MLDTPYFARTDEKGNARIESLPAGEYKVEVWHPRVRKLGEKREISVTDTTELDVQLNLKPAVRARRAPKARRVKRY